MRQHINLYLPEFQPVRDPLSARNILLAGVVTLLGVGAASGYYHQRSSAMQATIRQLSLEEGRRAEEISQLAQRYPAPQKNEALEAMVAELTRELAGKQQVLDLLAGNRTGNSEGFSRYLVALAKVRVEGVWLTRIGLYEGGRHIILQGQTRNPDLLPAYIQALSKEAALRQKRFHFFEMDKVSPEAERRRKGGDGEPAIPLPGQVPGQVSSPADAAPLINFSLRTIARSPLAPEAPERESVQVVPGLETPTGGRKRKQKPQQ